MKYKGYTGTLLKVDLSKGKIERTPLSEELAEDYIGGVGFAAKVISKRQCPWRAGLTRPIPSSS